MPPRYAGPSPWSAISAAFTAATAVPHYRELLTKAGVEPAQIDSPDAFRMRLPVLRKTDLFRDDVPFHRLCRNGDLGQPAELMASSGFSGSNAFAVITAAQAEETQAAVDAALDQLYGADQAKTLLINAFGMGLRVPTRHTLAATGPRPDLVLNLLGKFGAYFDQVIIIGDPHLLKAVVDAGNQRGVDWQRPAVSFGSGQDALPETLRTYICCESGIDPDDADGPRKYLQTMGLTELGLLLFLETPDSVRLRRAAMHDQALQRLLFGSEHCAVPALFHFDPERFHVEALPAGPAGGPAPELVFTTLSSAPAAPLIRYASGDVGCPLDMTALHDGLLRLGRADLWPRCPLPLAWTSGRLGSPVAGAMRPMLRLDLLRERLYQDIPSARQLTGQFHVSTPDPGTDRGPAAALAPPVRVEVQLRAGVAPTRALTETLAETLTAALAEAMADTMATALADQLGDTPGAAFGDGVGPPLSLRLCPYLDYGFGMEINFEKKFTHV